MDALYHMLYATDISKVLQFDKNHRKNRAGMPGPDRKTRQSASLTTFRAQKSERSMIRPMTTFRMSMNCTHR